MIRKRIVWTLIVLVAIVVFMMQGWSLQKQELISRAEPANMENMENIQFLS